MGSPVFHVNSRGSADEADVRDPATATQFLLQMCGADASAGLAAQIKEARRSACTQSLQAAMLLRSWMSAHD